MGKRDDPGNGKRADERERNGSNRAGIRTERRQSWIKTIRDGKKKEKERKREKERNVEMEVAHTDFLWVIYGLWRYQREYVSDIRIFLIDILFHLYRETKILSYWMINDALLDV